MSRLLTIRHHAPVHKLKICTTEATVVTTSHATEIFARVAPIASGTSRNQCTRQTQIVYQSATDLLAQHQAYLGNVVSERVFLHHIGADWADFEQVRTESYRRHGITGRLLPALACLGLYLVEPRASRVRVAVPAAAAAVMALGFVPLLLPFLDQFGRRAARMAAAGQPLLDFRRMLVRSPLVVPGLLADGLVPATARDLLSSPRLLAVAVAAACVQAWHVVAAALSRRLDRNTALWLALSGLLPFMVFLRDDPTARQFPLVWAALAACSAAAASRRPWAGIPALALCAALLPAYYRVQAFPYHRSGWMQAADYVLRTEPGAPVVLAGSRTALQAWEFYSRGRTCAMAPEGADPYRGEHEQAPRREAASAVDSILGEGGRAWVVGDRWGGADPLEGARAAVLHDTSFGTVGVRLVEAAR